eukprot:TRINITY_DN88513_c0_g1_i1.p3 TRINITY_DN88513_c0_g1~~TRINITY_DN88513_c0_g1_i1.p3  ORF type:complete len:270 (-),score=25.58 TRINITY_DN88513_c0_g1_i1:1108-1917(-)
MMPKIIRQRFATHTVKFPARKPNPAIASSTLFCKKPSKAKAIPQQAPQEEEKKVKATAELTKFCHPIPKKESKQMINNTLTSVILSLSGMRMNLIKEIGNMDIQDTMNRLVLPQNEVLSIEEVKLLSLNTEFGERMSKMIGELVDKSERFSGKPANVHAGNNPNGPYILQCGHKICPKFFLSHANKLKEKMKVGPLQFKCPYDCQYVLNDKDLATLLGPSFKTIITHYNVLLWLWQGNRYPPVHACFADCQTQAKRFKSTQTIGYAIIV